MKEVLKKGKGIIEIDDISKPSYPTVLDCVDKNEVFVGRIRRDFSVENGINFWCVADNIRKGAATNAVQIAQVLIENDFFGKEN